MRCGCCILSFSFIHEFGLSTERIEDCARQGIAWVWPNVLLGSIVIIPIWFVVFLFVRPGKSSD